MHFYYAKRMIVCSGDGERWKILSSSLSPAYGISRIVNATILPAMLEILFFIRVTILFDREFSHEFPFSFFSVPNTRDFIFCLCENFFPPYDVLFFSCANISANRPNFYFSVVPRKIPTMNLFVFRVIVRRF